MVKIINMLACKFVVAVVYTFCQATLAGLRTLLEES